MITLGIETSCDETACAVAKSGRILSSIVSSSVHLHKQYGGVVPEIASRYHLEYINAVVKKALKKAGIDFKHLDLAAVTYGPGLSGSLLVGISFAKAVSFSLSIPLVGVSHLNAHIYANFIGKKPKDLPKFPFIGLVISGGHTSIFLCKDIDDFKILGNTQDDAVGEAFDKVAKILGLGYPGGPVIEKIAKKRKRGEFIKFPIYLDRKSLDFSFSGIKTAVLYYAKNKRLTEKAASLIAYSFQEAVFDVIVEKVVSACRRERVGAVVIGGGVAANKRFCDKIKKAAKAKGIKVFIPDIRLCLDNAAMVAALGEALYKRGHSSKSDLTAVANLESMI